MARHVTAKETAKIARGLLKAAFPGHKFSVRSPNSVEVNWIDGPSEEQVKRILGPLEGRFYDGQWEETTYKYSWLSPDGTVSREKIPGAEEVCFGHFLFANRHYSQAFIEKAAAEKAKECGWAAPEIVEMAYYVGSTRKGTVWSYKADPVNKPHHRWFQEHLRAATEFPEEEAAPKAAPAAPVEATDEEATCPECCYYQNGRCPGVADLAGCDDFDNPNALVALEDPEGDPSPDVEHKPTVKKAKPAPEPKPEPLEIGPMPKDNVENMHWTARHVAHLMGDDWSYVGNPEHVGCDIMHKDGYGIHFWVQNRENKIGISGNWPRLVDEFHKGGWTFSPTDANNPKIGVSCGRDPAAVLRDIERRFLPKYLEIYPERLANRDETRESGIRRTALLEDMAKEVRGSRASSMYIDRVHFSGTGYHTWATVTVNSYLQASAKDLALPSGREVPVLKAIKNLFPAESDDPVLDRLVNDQGAIAAALVILKECTSDQDGPLADAIKALEGAREYCQDQIIEHRT